MKIIKEKLDKLKNADKNFIVFGARKHRYKSFPVLVKDITDFEKRFNFQLPTDFRQFLIEVGYGAGPYYGIYSLKEISEELQEIVSLKIEENIQVSPANPFPFNQQSIDEINIKVQSGTKEIWKKTTFPSNGSIPILTHGCTFYTGLVTSGDLIGQVWDVACYEGYNGCWLPSLTPQNLTVTYKPITGNSKFKILPEKENQNTFYESKRFEKWFEE